MASAKPDWKREWSDTGPSKVTVSLLSPQTFRKTVLGINT